MILGALVTSILGNVLSGQWVIRACEGTVTVGEGTITAGENF